MKLGSQRRGRRSPAMREHAPMLVLGGAGKTGRRAAHRRTALHLPIRIGSHASDLPCDWQRRQEHGSSYCSYAGASPKQSMRRRPRRSPARCGRWCARPGFTRTSAKGVPGHGACRSDRASGQQVSRALRRRGRLGDLAPDDHVSPTDQQDTAALAHAHDDITDLPTSPSATVPHDPNAHLADDGRHLSGHLPREFADYACRTAAGVWNERPHA